MIPTHPQSHALYFSPPPFCTNIHWGRGIVQGDFFFHSLKSSGKKIFILCDEKLLPFFGEAILKNCLKRGMSAELIACPSGEEAKTRQTKARIEDELLLRSCERDDILLAIGGGTSCDLAACLAASYCRGLSLFLVPTTLLAMVDAAVGGKCALNTRLAKNLIGHIYPAQAIFIDSDFLVSLPKKQWREGLAEICKHACVEATPLPNFRSRHMDRLSKKNRQRSLFHFLQQKNEEIRKGKPDVIDELIERAALVKIKIVSQDPWEKGLRRILNFGHSFAHAAEKISNYSLSHGDAVSWGLYRATALSQESGYLNTKKAHELFELFRSYSLVDSLPFDPSKELWKNLKKDKKSVNGAPRFVLLNDIGIAEAFDGEYCVEVAESMILSMII